MQRSDNMCTWTAEIRQDFYLLSTVLSMNPFSLYWKSSWAASSLASPPDNTTRYALEYWYGWQDTGRIEELCMECTQTANPDPCRHTHWQHSWHANSQLQTKTEAHAYAHSCKLRRTHKPTFICYTGGVTEAAAMTEGLNGGILITERLHMSMLPSWRKSTEIII